MPSQIAHFLFAREVIEKGLGSEGNKMVRRYPELIAFYAQGPDIFYHNQRTRPGAFKYGRVIHRHGFGELAGNFVLRRYRSTEEEIEARNTVILSYITHAFLDRIMHPFIIYFSGWRVPGDRDTDYLYRMHPFFERICDLLLAEKRYGFGSEEFFSFSFFDMVRPVSRRTEICNNLIVPAIQTTYNRLNKPDMDETRFANAMHDALYFYKATNPPARENLCVAYKRDKASQFLRKILALYYPRNLDKTIDYMNEAGKEWQSPFNPSVVRTESFYDLYDQAMEKTVKAVRGLYEVLDKGSVSREDAETVRQIVGNGNLSEGSETKNPVPVVSEPLPLYRQLLRQYQFVEREFCLDKVFEHK